MKLNRISNRLIFPGQKLKVPHLEINEVFEEEEEKVVEKKFLKVKVRHVTDGNVSFLLVFYREMGVFWGGLGLYGFLKAQIRRRFFTAQPFYAAQVF